MKARKESQRSGLPCHESYSVWIENAQYVRISHHELEIALDFHA